MTKRESEKKMVGKMIRLYCRKNHERKEASLCAECDALRVYAFERCDKCPFMETKTFCSNCDTPCYRPDMRESIRNVMRFSGPRMIYHSPRMAMKYVMEKRKKRRQQ